nr:MAG TPA: hypothetical protein [Caudoviricetes sp.]
MFSPFFLKKVTFFQKGAFFFPTFPTELFLQILYLIFNILEFFIV